MEAFHLVILDIASDSSNETAQQLKNFVKKKQSSNAWPERLHVLGENDKQSNENVQDANTTLVSLLFDVKNKIDSDGHCDFVLVTSLLLKKFWEKVCHNLFSPVHNWSVYGVTVNDQPLDNIMTVAENKVDDTVKKFLMTVRSKDDMEILRPHSIPSDKFNAGFSTRKGGVSSLRPLASLNLVYTSRKVDPIAVVDENRRRLAVTAGFDPSSIHSAKVEHGNSVRVIEKEFHDDLTIRYDGLVTNTPGVTLFAPSADCCPILLADTKTGACGAVHSGWMGTVKGAVRETLKTMMNEYGTEPVHVVAAIGPSVETHCFSLPSSSAQPLTDLDPSLTPPNKDKTDWVNTNLVRANAIMLEQDGVLPENIDTTWALCTKCHSERFFSHQRDGVPFGSQVGFITCKKK